MRALSLYQPWATLVVRGKKKVETRSKPIAPGVLLIHAAARWTQQLAEETERWPFADWLAGLRIGFHRPPRRRFDYPQEPELLPFGALIGWVVVTGCHDAGGLKTTWSIYEDGAAERYAEEVAAGFYAAGRFGYLLERAHWLERPIPFAGNRGLFRVPTPDAVRVLDKAVPATDNWSPLWPTPPVRPAHLFPEPGDPQWPNLPTTRLGTRSTQPSSTSPRSARNNRGRSG